MSFSSNTSQQISIFEATTNLTSRELKMLDKSWAKYFSEIIFPAIDEEPFQVLYSKRPSRYNTPVNVIIGALIIKEIFGLTDEEMVETLPFDIRYQYALHTTSFEEQPLNDRTFGRFRARCNTYEESTGIDLIHGCISSLSSKIAQLMSLNSGLRRMDSLMIASNIKKMGRLELLYTCVVNMCRMMDRSEDKNFPESLKHYLDESDHNELLYHNRSENTDSKITTVLKDAALIKTACDGIYDHTSEYQLLIRVIKEQTIVGNDGELVLKDKSSGMNSTILQNPADPDATYIKKAGKENRGYIANVVEQGGREGSIVIDYQVEQNIYSDSQFLKDYIKKQPEDNPNSTLVTDGGYCGNENAKLAKEKNIQLVTTDLKGTEVNDLWADFEFNESGTEITKCAGGYIPKTNVYDKNTQKCKVSFPIEICKGCSHFKECNPVMHKRVATIKLAQRTSHHAKQQRFLKTDEFKALAKYRNGVETVPAALRKKHNIDRIPVRGLSKCRFYFGIKIAAMNVRKLVKYMTGLNSYALKTANG